MTDDKSFLDPRRLQRMTQNLKAQITLNCLTRLRRGLDMPHWHCHASNQQTTDNKLLCRLQGTLLVPFHCTCAQQAHSNRDEIQPVHRCTVPSICPHTIHRCTVPSICPHTNTQVYRSFHLSTYQYSKRIVLDVTVEDQVSGRETGVHSVTHVS